MLQALMLPLVTCLLLLPATATAQESQSDPYQRKVIIQLNKINPTADQLGEFQKRLKAYYQKRNKATRRVSSGGDLAVTVRRELRKVKESSLEDMAGLLTENQMQHYEDLLDMANKQYLYHAGLL